MIVLFPQEKKDKLLEVTNTFWSSNYLKLGMWLHWLDFWYLIHLGSYVRPHFKSLNRDKIKALKLTKGQFDKTM